MLKTFTAASISPDTILSAMKAGRGVKTTNAVRARNIGIEGSYAMCDDRPSGTWRKVPGGTATVTCKMCLKAIREEPSPVPVVIPHPFVFEPLPDLPTAQEESRVARSENAREAVFKRDADRRRLEALLPAATDDEVRAKLDELRRNPSGGFSHGFCHRPLRTWREIEMICALERERERRSTLSAHARSWEASQGRKLRESAA